MSRRSTYTDNSVRTTAYVRVRHYVVIREYSASGNRSRARVRALVIIPVYFSSVLTVLRDIYADLMAHPPARYFCPRKSGRPSHAATLVNPPAALIPLVYRNENFM